MAINYTSYIPRIVTDNQAPLDQAPNFQHVYEWDTWNRYNNPDESMFQYYRPGDLNYYRQDNGPKDLNYWKQKVGGPQGDAQSADPANSTAASEPQDFKSRMQAVIHDPNSMWEQSAARGRAMNAADSGESIGGGSLNPNQVARRNAAVGTPEWFQSKLPSGSPNGPIDYSHTGKTLNGDGKNALREKGWTEEQINSLTDGTMGANWGADMWADDKGYQDHTQEQYEAFQRALQAANQSSGQGGSYGGGGGGYSAPSSRWNEYNSNPELDPVTSGYGSYDPGNSSLPDYGRNGNRNSYDPYNSSLPDVSGPANRATGMYQKRRAYDEASQPTDADRARIARWKQWYDANN